MNFINSLESFQYVPQGMIIGEGKKIGSNEDLFFRAKQNEIYDQYCAARIFMRETEFQVEEKDKYLTSLSEMYKSDLDMGVYLKSIFYESALIYYNIVVDLTWVLTYACIEYFCFENQCDILPLKGIQDVDTARKSLIHIEENTVSPGSVNNPFTYLRQIAPAFNCSIDIIKQFWDKYCNDKIRNRYNYIKHRGKPYYLEVKDERIFNAYSGSGESFVQLASAVSDVSERYSLDEAIKDLQEFDDNCLFEYVYKLIKELENIVKPTIV